MYFKSIITMKEREKEASAAPSINTKQTTLAMKGFRFRSLNKKIDKPNINLNMVVNFS